MAGLKSPTTEELSQLIHTISGRIGRYLEKAGLLIRVFKIDIETCVHCGGAVKIIACIEDPVVIGKYWRISNNANQLLKPCSRMLRECRQIATIRVHASL